ncbi:ethanolamine ammonia-lyase subunit EutC [Terriglobus roseus]|uniref:Ethanolamine ammonia-lyase small subunit n=1 Tax=Terriglobus roseus TaxID=392734 RepID=A0A1G7KJ63_9BACT|nr:ethanolamine ammonia-lyase subunit EutC [Terriglobus roseus]SDF37232.1 Ethanolamine ammonia-lyase light chain [Terriglobus roseus]
MERSLVNSESWSSLSEWTSARIALGRVGVSLPTNPLLDFTMDHARARDAVHAALDLTALSTQLYEHGFIAKQANSKAKDRSEYLRRPDLGRQLDPNCIALLQQEGMPRIKRITIVVADGLSALAPSLHALPMLTRLRDALPDWELDPVVATQARVALADDIGELRLANISLIFIGERPGLKSPDSLGAYLTYAPRRGRTDAERNCVSNIRPAGLSYDEAAFRLAHLIQSAYALGVSGTQLKDDSDSILPMLSGS